MDRLRRLGKQWSLGFATLLLLGISAVAFGLLAILVLAILQLAAGALGFQTLAAWDARDLLEVAAFVWLPLSAGVVLPSIAYHFASHIREIEESKRKAELAPYLKAGRQR